jgi:ubiquinone/menaquinone biosynthesis C-methylase UbiE
MLSRGLDLLNRRRLLDVAGGTGAFSIALCKQNPNLTAVVLDFPNVAALAKTYIEDAGLTSRISTIGANALAAEWPAGQDVVLMSYLLSAVAADAIDVLIAKAHAALSPGGLLIVHDFMLDDDELGPSLAAEWFLLSLALNTRAISFTAADVSRRLTRVGFFEITSREHIHEITKLVLAHKPLG